MKHIGIVGSRRRNTEEDFQIVKKKLLSVYSVGDVIVSGGCPKGADKFAERLAEELGIRDTMVIFPADWKRFGRGAGFIRNTDIAKLSEYLIACVAENRKGGTEDTITKFMKFHSDKNLHLC